MAEQLIDGKHYWIKYIHEKPEPRWIVGIYKKKFNMFHCIGKMLEPQHCEINYTPIVEPNI
jgi:hypothetical protein